MFLVKLFGVTSILIGLSLCQDTRYSARRTGDQNGQQQQRSETNERLIPNDFHLANSKQTFIHSADYHSYHDHNHNQGPIHNHHDHGKYIYHYLDEDELEPINNAIPLDFAKTINKYNITDLLLNFIDDGPDLSQKPVIISRFAEDESENDTERSSIQMARAAKCMPELKTVKIVESKDPNVFYIPECTRIERCGGCCSHTLLSCQAVETETVTLSVLKTEYTSGAKKLKYVGKEPVLVEKHNKCQCNCKTKREDCNHYQEYVEAECRCTCKNIDEEKKCYKKNTRKLWNPDQCACQCRNVTTCSTGYQFDFNDCRCVESQMKRRYILNDNRKEEPDTI